MKKLAKQSAMDVQEALLDKLRKMHNLIPLILVTFSLVVRRLLMVRRRRAGIPIARATAMRMTPMRRRRSRAASSPPSFHG